MKSSSKNLIIGILLGFTCALVIGAAGDSGTCRYQMEVESVGELSPSCAIFVLDTQSGEVYSTIYAHERYNYFDRFPDKNKRISEDMQAFKLVKLGKVQ